MFSIFEFVLKKLKIDRSYWLYGLIVGVFLVILEIVQYKAFVREIRLEIAGFIIGVVFLVLGVWFGVRFFSRQIESSKEQYDATELGLSKRELEVLQLLSDGYSNQEISDRLFVSLNTTKTHISSIYAKLGVSRRTQAVQKARELSSQANQNGK